MYLVSLLKILNLKPKNGDNSPTLKMVGGYGRSDSGNIAVFYNGFFHDKVQEKSSKGKKK
jgi:hypothetical protein